MEVSGLQALAELVALPLREDTGCAEAGSRKGRQSSSASFVRSGPRPRAEQRSDTARRSAFNDDDAATGSKRAVGFA